MSRLPQRQGPVYPTHTHERLVRRTRQERFRRWRQRRQSSGMPWREWLPMYASAVLLATVTGWFGLTLWVSGLGTPRPRVGYTVMTDPVLTVLRGSAVIRHPEWPTVTLGTIHMRDALIYPGDEIETGPNSAVALRYGEGSTMEIDESTLVTVDVGGRLRSADGDIPSCRGSGGPWYEFARSVSRDGVPAATACVHSGGAYLPGIPPDR